MLSFVLLYKSDLQAKKPKKSVNEYYKKQNELLENFKNDSEQIQVFQKTRTRQRLESTSSQNCEANAFSVPNPADEPKAPLLASVVCLTAEICIPVFRTTMWMLSRRNLAI